MNLKIIGPTTSLQGSVTVPGDKSISHRALLLSAMAEGTSRVSGLLDAGVTRVMLDALAELGVDWEFIGDGDLVLMGGDWRQPHTPLDCGNSGTTMRTLLGALAAVPLEAVLTGSDQLSRRPMDRVVEPLRRMGAEIVGEGPGWAPPLHVHGQPLHGIEYRMPVASAQVKTALLLAGLRAQGATTVVEDAPTRDHTERMLRSLGVPVRISNGTIQVHALESPIPPMHHRVPGDLSSAAFLLTAAASLPGSQLALRGVGVNPRRTGILDALMAMGSPIHVTRRRLQNDEPMADIEVAGGALRSIELGDTSIVRTIDEIPVLAVAMTQAEGVSRVKDAAELRVKESDRIGALAKELGKMGARVEGEPDGFRVWGPTPLKGAHVQAHGDHRLAMSLAVAGLLAEGETVINGAECIDQSFPGFVELLAGLGVEIG